MKKNETAELTISTLASDGEGIGRIDGFPVFVKDSVPGDRCSVRITKVKKNMAYGKILQILTPSPHRVVPECPIAVRCGGCSLQSMDYEEELRFKEERVRECLRRIGGIPEEEILRAAEPILAAENPFRYRNKAQYPIGRDRNGEIRAGFYARGSHEIIPCTDCLLSPPEFADILKCFTDHMKKYGIDPYDEKTGKGIVRHLMLRKAFSTGQIMAVPVLTKASLKHSEELLSAWEELGVTTAVLNVNPEVTNVILGKQNITLFGKGYIEDELCSLTFRISPLSFYQVNPVQAAKVYETAFEYAALTGKEEVWDVCCGIGTISLLMARRAGKVHGIEIVPEAVRDAGINAEKNGIKNAVFTAAPAEKFLPEQIREKDRPENLVVILDPPRSGMEKEALLSVIEISPERIVYVSCDPATLARDLKLLCGAGYRLERFRPADQFSRTSHVETVCLLEKK